MPSPSSSSSSSHERPPIVINPLPSRFSATTIATTSEYKPPPSPEPDTSQTEASPALPEKTGEDAEACEEKVLSLVEAAGQGDLEGVGRALARGETLDLKDVEGRDALLASLMARPQHRQQQDISTLDSDSLPIHVQILHRLLSSSSPTLLSLNIPQAAVKGVPLLGLACYLGDLEIVRLLLGEDSWKTAEDESGGRGKGWVLVDGKDAKGGTPLMYAARDNHVEIAQVLLEQGAQPDRIEIHGESSLKYGLPNPHIVWMFEEFLRNRRLQIKSSTVHHPFPNIARLAAFSSSSNPPPPPSAFESTSLADFTKRLISAVKHSELDVVRSILFPPPPFLSTTVDENDSSLPSNPLVTRGLVNAADQHGMTPLHHALRVQPCPSLEVIEALWFAGADMNMGDLYGATPLHQLACLAGGSSLSRRPPRARDSPVAVTESSLSSSTSLASHRSLLPSVAEEAVEPSIAIDSPSGLIDTEQTKARACSTGGSTIKDGGGDRNRDARGKNPLTDEETERKLREIARRLIYDFDSDPDLVDAHGATPLHFAAEFGCSRAIVQVLLERDLELEQKDLAERMRLPGVSLERAPIRKKRNSSGLSPSDLARPDLVDLFRYYNDLAEARKLAIVPDPDRLVRLSRGVASTTQSRSSRLSSPSGSSSVGRDSILLPLAPISSLAEVEDSLNQVGVNLAFVDEQLTTGLIATVKSNLDRENLSHPDDHYLSISPVDNEDRHGRAPSIRRLRTSFQTEKSSRSRRMSTSTGSSWWSSARSVYSHSQIEKMKTDLDSIFRLFGHTTQMVHRSIEFYDKDIKSLLEDIKAYELAAKAGLSSLSSLRTTELVVLHSQENALIAALDASENEREDRSFDDRIATFVFGVWNEFALATSTATRVLSGRAATMEVSKVADEARTTLEGLKEELLEHESLTEDLSLRIDTMLDAIKNEKTTQLTLAIASSFRTPTLTSPPTTPTHHQARQRQPSNGGGGRNRPTTIYSTPTIDYPPSPTSFGSSSRQSTPQHSHFFQSPQSVTSTSYTVPSQRCREVSTADSVYLFFESAASGPQGLPVPAPKSEVGNEGERPEEMELVPKREPQPWDSWPRAKEEEPEYAIAQMNLEEIEKDLEDVEEGLEAAAEREAQLTRIMSTLGRRTDARAAKEKLEVFTLMQIILSRRIELEQRRDDLEEEQNRVTAVLERYEDAEENATNTAKLATFLRTRLQALHSQPTPTSPTARPSLLYTELDDEAVSFSPFSKEGPSGRASACADLAREEGRLVRELNVVRERLEGVEDLMRRCEGDWKEIGEERVRMITTSLTSALNQLSKSKASFVSLLQSRMDEIAVLWELLQSGSDQDSSRGSSSASSFYLDIRDQIPLPPLITDPLPLHHPRAATSSSSASSFSSFLQTSTSSHHSPSRSTSPLPPRHLPGFQSPRSATSSSGSGASSDGSAAPVPLQRLREWLREEVHDPLEGAQREAAQVGKWVEIVEAVVEGLKGRLGEERR